MNLIIRIVVGLLLIQNFIYPQIKIHKKLGVEDGLIQSTIRTIYKDSDGRLWFGTNLGVSCWDGINFKNYSTANGLPGHTVFAIQEDKKKNIYFGTSNGASIFRNETFFDLKTNDKTTPVRIKDIEISQDGEMYFISDKDLYILEKNYLKKTPFSDQIADASVSSITKDQKGNIILGTRGSGYLKIESGKFKTTNIEPVKYINSIYIRANNDIVLISGTKIHIIKQNGAAEQIDLEQYESINTVAEDMNGVLFIGTNKGIVLWQNKIIDQINTSNGLSNNKVFSIFRDDDGSMYIGLNSGGVAVINRYRILLFNEDIGLVNNNVTSICQGSSDEYYFGTREHGVSVFRNGKFSEMDIFNQMNCNQVICITKMRNGDIYFGTNGGVVILSKGKFSKFTKDNGLESNIVTAISEAPDGKISVGTVRGLSIISGSHVKNFTRKNGLGDNLVTSICSDEKGTIYVGTFFNGVTRIDDEKLTIINKEKGLISNTVYSIYSGKEKLYIGTIEGLNIISGDSVRLLNSVSGLSDNSINSIIEDETGNAYIASNRGINILFPSGDQYKIKVLLSEDGISGEECNMGAVYNESSGKLWFGTIKGVVSFDPEKITPGLTPPAISLRNIYMFDHEVQYSRHKITYSHNQNFFRFVFFGVLLSAPKRVVYSYRMKGLSENWSLTNQNSVQFTNLDPGNYQFEIKAKNEWGYWSKPVVYSFVIEPPLWQRLWFILLSTLVLGSVSSILIVRHVKALLNIERLRLKIAAELHDNIGSSLTEISIMSEVAKNKLLGDNPEVMKYLDLIGVECRNLISGMKDIVWMVNPQKDTLKDLIIRLNDSFSEIFNQKGISFRAENIELLHRITLPMDYRHNLYLILKEGINNSLKYSQCDELCLIAKLKGNHLEVILKDNGVGIVSHSEGYGLYNMKNRAKKIGGDLQIESNVYEGTEIRFVGKVA